MTLLGKRNHYNVKLLRGYGVSIILKDNRVALKNGLDILTGQRETEEWFVTEIPYETIVISGKGYVSTDAVRLLTEKNINVLLTDTYGNLLSCMNNVTSSNTATRYRMGQYDTFRDPVKVRYLQNQILKAKFDSQMAFLRSLEKDELTEGINALTEYRAELHEERGKRELLGIESGSGRAYFGAYGKLFHPRYGFLSRRGGGLRFSNRYASDIINALLNYGYTVLAGEITKFVNALGLDPYHGFYHTTHSSFPALVYDLIEPFRWLVESTAYKFSLVDSHQRPTRKEYTWTREGNLVMSDNLIRRFQKHSNESSKRRCPTDSNMGSRETTECQCAKRSQLQRS